MSDSEIVRELEGLLSIVVPCYNEEAVLHMTYERLIALCDQLPNVDLELIFVDDGSRDTTPELLRSFASADKRVGVITFSRNFGHQAAITAGLRAAKGSWVAVLDADLQDPPELLPEMLDHMLSTGANVVYGVRQKRLGESLFKRISARCFYRMINSMSEVELPLDAGDFRLLDRRVVDEFASLHEHNKYVRGLVSWIGFKQEPFYYQRQARSAGETKYSLRRMLCLAANSFYYFSHKPLMIASTLGFLSVVVGLLLALWIVLGKIFGFTQTMTGWPSIVTIVIFFGGVQLLTIGLLSRYIAVIFDEVKQRPEYIIASQQNISQGLNKEMNNNETTRDIH